MGDAPEEVTDSDLLADSPLPTAEGLLLNHPRFLEWIGVPDLASLLDMGPGRWLDALSREQAMAAATQLHREHSGPVCPLAAEYCFEDAGDKPRLQ